MADDMLIGVGVKADFSSLKAESKASADAVRQAEATWKEAFQQLGQSAELGNEQAIAVLKEYEQALAQARARSMEAQQALARLGGAASRTVPQIAAASGAIHLLEGTLPIRAVERFAATTLGLGPILQAAFPIIGAAALGEMLVVTGKKVYDFYQDVVNLKGVMADLDAIDLKVLSKVKALGDQTEAAHIRFIELTQGMEAARKEELRWQSQKPISLDDFFNDEKFRQFPDRVKAGFEEAYKNIAPDQLDAKVAAVKSKIADLQDIIANPMKHRTIVGANKNGPVFALPDAAQVQGQLRIAKDIDERLEAEARSHAEKMKEIGAEIQSSEIVKGDKAPKDNSAKERGQEIMAMVKENADAQKEAQRVTDEVQAAGIRGLKEEEEEQRKAADAEKGRMEDEKKQYEEQLRLVQDIARARMADATSAIDEKMGAVRAQGQEGLLNPQREAAELTALVNQKQQIEDGYYQQIESLYSTDSLKWQEFEDQKLSAQRKNAAEMVKINQDAARQEMRIYGQLAQSMNRELVGAMNNILTGQTSVARGAEQMASHMLLSFVDTMTEEVLQHALAKEIMLAHEAAHWLAVNVLHTASKATQAATDAAANATQLTTAIATNVASAMSYAAVAGAAGLASTAAIPFVGPFMAPGVAAGLYAAGLGFAGMASAAGGWDQIPSDQIAQVHKDEMVLSAPIASFIRSAAGGGSGGPSSAPSVHFGGNTFNGVADQKTFKAMLQKNNREVARSTQRAIRNGHFARGN